MSRGPFCYLCGATSDELVQGLCSSCFLKEKKPVKLPKRIRTSICRECGNSSLSPVAEEAVRKNISGDLEELEIKVSIKDREESGKKILLDLEVETAGKTMGLEYRSLFNPVLEINRILCPDCSRRAGGYYESVIQLRSEDAESMLRELHSYMNQLYKRDKRAYISGETKAKGGVDIKLGSTRAAKQLASHFRSLYGVDVKESATVVGKKEGRDLYRTTILIRR